MELLVTGAWHATNEDINELKQLGYRVTLMPQEEGEMPLPYEKVEGVVCNRLFEKHPIEKFTNLRYIHLTGAGFDQLPMDYIKARAIVWQRAQGVYSIPMAEYAIWGVLSLYRRQRVFEAQQKKHAWVKQRDLSELGGKTVAIIGCGDVGSECAKRFEAFGCSVVRVHRDLLGLEQAMQADVVVVTVALVPKTFHLIQPTRMKPGSILVLLSRGAVVDTEDLLRAHQLGGAVLDVFEEEPLRSDSPLWERENFILTPHNSFVGDHTAERLSSCILQHLREISADFPKNREEMENAR